MKNNSKSRRSERATSALHRRINDAERWAGLAEDNKLVIVKTSKGAVAVSPKDKFQKAEDDIHDLCEKLGRRVEQVAA